jgi:hypothetical protein
MSIDVRREQVPASLALLAPRLRLGAAAAHGTLLDGGWWPRSADPAAELPGLIRVIEDRWDRVTRLMLGPAGWDSQPRQLRAADRVVKIGWFPGQPAGLLTALCASGSRVDLLVVPSDTAQADALAAMDMAVQADNLIHAPDILAAVARDRDSSAEAGPGLTVRESEGGRLERSEAASPAQIYDSLVSTSLSTEPTASSTVAQTENTSAMRVVARTRITAFCGAASTRSPPARRACLRPCASAATPLESMNCRPARSTMIPGSRAATAASAAATLTASATSSSPRNATTAWPTQLRVLRSVLNMAPPFLLSSKAGSWPGSNSRGSAMNDTPDARDHLLMRPAGVA